MWLRNVTSFSPQGAYLIFIVYGLVADYQGRAAFYETLWADDEVREARGGGVWHGGR